MTGGEGASSPPSLNQVYWNILMYRVLNGNFVNNTTAYYFVLIYKNKRPNDSYINLINFISIDLNVFGPLPPHH